MSQEINLELFGDSQIGGVLNPDIRNLKDVDGRRVTLIGFTKGEFCKNCAFFYRVQYAKVYRRCELYPNKNWKSNFEACSKFKREKP